MFIKFLYLSEISKCFESLTEIELYLQIISNYMVLALYKIKLLYLLCFQ